MKQLAEEIGGFYDGLADTRPKRLFINLHGLVVDVQRHSRFKSTLRMTRAVSPHKKLSVFVPLKMFLGSPRDSFCSYRTNFNISRPPHLAAVLFYHLSRKLTREHHQSEAGRKCDDVFGRSRPMMRVTLNVSCVRH